MHDDAQELARRKVLRDIARVASLGYQLRECLDGTADRYVLLDELLETTITRAEHEASHPVLSRKWKAEQLQALLAFARRTSKLFDEIRWQDPSVSLGEIIRSRSMQQIRDAADECLRCVGVNCPLEELIRD